MPDLQVIPESTTQASTRLMRVLRRHAQFDLSQQLDIGSEDIKNCGGSCDVYQCRLQLQPDGNSEEESNLDHDVRSTLVAVKRLRYFGSLDSETERVCPISFSKFNY